MQKLQWIERKILDPVTLMRQVHMWRSFGKKIVFTNGVFDILHRGHIDLLANAANMGNILITGINTDASVKRLKGEERPVNNQQDRAFQLAGMLCVDAVCFFEEDTPAELIKMISPDVLVKGGDYSVATIVGADHVTSYGGEVAVVPIVAGYSTSALINAIKKL